MWKVAMEKQRVVMVWMPKQYKSYFLEFIPFSSLCPC